MSYDLLAMSIDNNSVLSQPSPQTYYEYMYRVVAIIEVTNINQEKRIYSSRAYLITIGCRIFLKS